MSVLQGANYAGQALAVHRKMAEKNPNVFMPFVALTLNNLGSLYANHYKEQKAADAYLEALEINRELAAKNPKAFYPFVAHTLRSMGGYYEKYKKKEKAEAVNAEAEGIERRFGKQ